VLAAPPKLAWTIAAAAALAAGGAVGAGVAGIEPSLFVKITPISTTADSQVYELRAEPRGGETIPLVRIELPPGRVELLGRDTFHDLLPDNAARFTLRIARDDPQDPVVRIVQGGRVERTYDVPLPVDRR
jgi:hypothetical protein